MFEKTLSDVVKGLRSQPTSELRNEFAQKCLEECRKELSSPNPAIKTNALNKVAHLRMLEYDQLTDDSTSFHVIEGMAISRFTEKRVAMSCASRLLTHDSKMLLLSTNTFKKQLQSSEPYVIGLGKQCLI